MSEQQPPTPSSEAPTLVPQRAPSATEAPLTPAPGRGGEPAGLDARQATAAAAAVSLTGQVWGDFEFGELLGKGGMGVVYRGRQISLDRPVAIKVLPRELGEDDQFRERFLRESRAVGRIVSEHVVQVYFAGQHQGQHFYAMEYVDGKDLQRRLKGGWRPTHREALEIVLQAARGLAAAGELGLVHRDIKPGNLIMTGRGVVKLMDFGLVRLTSEQNSLTRTGVVMGTVSYFSPEQGRGERTDQRSDLYSLGVVLFELLTGTLPFVGESATSVIYQHIHETPRAPHEIDASVPAAYDGVVMRCLAKRPEQRYSSAAELIADLEAIAAGRGARSLTRAATAMAVLALIIVAACVAFVRGEHAAASPAARPAAQPTAVVAASTSARSQADIPTPAIEPPATAAVTTDASAAITDAASASAAPAATVPPSPSAPPAAIVPVAVPPSAVRSDPPSPVAVASPANDVPTADAAEIAASRAAPVIASREPATSDAPQPTRAQPNQPPPIEPEVVAPPIVVAAPPAIERAVQPTPAASPTVAAPTPPAASPDAPTARPEPARIAPKPAPAVARPAGPAVPPGFTPAREDAYGWYADLVVAGDQQRFRWCAPGEFRMGSPGDERGHEKDELEHQVQLTHGFWLADTECTQAWWLAIVGETPAKFRDPRLPVESVSRADCERFCDLLTTRVPGLRPRLPSEAEWEYACRAGAIRPYGDVVELERGAACFHTKTTAPVRSYRPNAWGLYDMIGNVREWCADVYRPYPDAAVVDPLLVGDGKGVTRGGCWDDGPRDCRAARRQPTKPTARAPLAGLRLAVDAPTSR